MTPSRSLVALVLLAVVGLALPATAAGPLDGAYALTASSAGAAGNDLFMVVLQNDSTLVILVLDPLDSSWTFGVGTLDADQQVAGTLNFGDSLGAGTFQIRFQGGTVTGTITLYEFAQSVTGTKLF
jgi:hypothetical protein